MIWHKTTFQDYKYLINSEIFSIHPESNLLQASDLDEVSAQIWGFGQYFRISEPTPLINMWIFFWFPPLFKVLHSVHSKLLRVQNISVHQWTRFFFNLYSVHLRNSQHTFIHCHLGGRSWLSSCLYIQPLCVE